MIKTYNPEKKFNNTAKIFELNNSMKSFQKI